MKFRSCLTFHLLLSWRFAVVQVTVDTSGRWSPPPPPRPLLFLPRLSQQAQRNLTRFLQLHREKRRQKRRSSSTSTERRETPFISDAPPAGVRSRPPAAVPCSSSDSFPGPALARVAANSWELLPVLPRPRHSANPPGRGRLTGRVDRGLL